MLCIFWLFAVIKWFFIQNMDIYLVRSECIRYTCLWHAGGTLDRQCVGMEVGHVLCVAPWIKVCVCNGSIYAGVNQYLFSFFFCFFQSLTVLDDSWAGVKLPQTPKAISELWDEAVSREICFKRHWLLLLIQLYYSDSWWKPQKVLFCFWQGQFEICSKSSW